jgi:hypothetical protein
MLTVKRIVNYISTLSDVKGTKVDFNLINYAPQNSNLEISDFDIIFVQKFKENEA